MFARLIFTEPLQDSIFVTTQGDNPKLNVARIFLSSIRGRRHLGRVVAEVAGISRQERCSRSCNDFMSGSKYDLAQFSGLISGN